MAVGPSGQYGEFATHRGLIYQIGPRFADPNVSGKATGPQSIPPGTELFHVSGPGGEFLNGFELNGTFVSFPE
jgi:hypothetical protein